MGNYNTVLNRLRKEGYQAELHLSSYAKLKLEKEDEDEAITPIEVSSTGYSIRVIKDGRLGAASSNVFNNELVEKAMQMAKVSEPDKDQVLPTQETRGKSTVNFGFRLGGEVDRIKGIMYELLDIPEWKLSHASVSASNRFGRVISTEGVDVQDTRSWVSADLVVYTKSPTSEPMPEVYEGASSTALNISVRELKESLAAKIGAMKFRVKNDRKYEEVVLTPNAASELLGTLIEPAFSGESLYRQSTPVSEGMDIGNPNISVIDDPAVKYSPSSAVFDGEGQRKYQLHLIRDGKVESFMYDAYWAHKAGKPTTNSAGGASNLVIKAPEEKDVSQGTLVVDQLQGVHGSDVASGRFSVNAGLAWRNLNGKTEGVRDVIIAGDLVSLLRGIESMSSRKRNMDGVVVGDLRVRGLSVG